MESKVKDIKQPDKEDDTRDSQNMEVLKDKEIKVEKRQGGHIDQQNEILNELKKQHEEQQRLIDEQKKILEELKEHKEEKHKVLPI